MNVAILEAAKQSLLADPDFDMGTWDHCIAGHICKVSGLTIGRTVFGSHVVVNNEARRISQVATEYVGVPAGSLDFLFGCPVEARHDKEHAIGRIDWVILASQGPSIMPWTARIPEPEPAAELPELVGV